MSGSRKAAVPVHIHGPDGQTHVFSPGDEVPADLARRVSNPDVWGDNAEVDETPEVPSDSPPPPAAPATPAPAEVEESDSEIPPKSGPEGSRAAWAEYAESVGVTVTSTMKRNEIIAAVESAGHPTE